MRTSTTRVRITALTKAALNGGSCQLRSRNSRMPWNNPQSTSTCACPVSIRYFEPVTVPAAPQKESVDMVLGLVLQRKQNIGIHRTCPSGFLKEGFRKERGHPVRQRAQPAQILARAYFLSWFALRAQADRMSALH